MEKAAGEPTATEAEAWYFGYLSALKVLEETLDDLVPLRQLYTVTDIKEMIATSKKIMEKSYKEEFSGRVLN